MFWTFLGALWLGCAVLAAWLESLLERIGWA